MVNASHFIEIVPRMQVISHIERLGQHIIVLNSIKAIMDMLDKKSSPYSDRPFFYGWRTYWREAPLPLLPYGDRFRWHRKFTASLAVAPL
jgi:hypothetical protein